MFPENIKPLAGLHVERPGGVGGTGILAVRWFLPVAHRVFAHGWFDERHLPLI
jgi:hypothetical protein